MNDILEKQIKETMETAFWDLIKDDLDSEPQKFDHLMLLIDEIKSKIKNLTPKRTDLHEELDEFIDTEFLKHLFETKGFDPEQFFQLIHFLIKKVKTYAAPYMDNDINEWEFNMQIKLQDKIEYFIFIKDFFTTLHIFLDQIHKDVYNFYSQNTKNN